MNEPETRRKFLKQCLMGGCGVALGLSAGKNLLFGDSAAESKDFLGGAKTSAGVMSLKEALWYEALGDSAEVTCLLCPRECVLGEGATGNCRARTAKKGKLYTLAYGNPCAVHLDPIEKKPLYHFLPGTTAFSIATAGCNMHCLNCQNWEISQSSPNETNNLDMPPSAVVDSAKMQRAASIAYTYSEPVVFYEYTFDTAEIARKHGLKNVLVTAGYINRDPLRQLCKVTDGAHVDLKSFNEDFYRRVCRTSLKPVLETLRTMKEEGVWVEVTRLVIPTLSDDINDIREMAKWMVANLGADTPLHLLRFHPAHKLTNLPLTPAQTLKQAKDAAREAGLNYVYVGNLPGNESSDTICPACKKTVIVREGFLVVKNNLKNGVCECGKRIAGVWV